MCYKSHSLSYFLHPTLCFCNPPLALYINLIITADSFTCNHSCLAPVLVMASWLTPIRCHHHSAVRSTQRAVLMRICVSLSLVTLGVGLLKPGLLYFLQQCRMVLTCPCLFQHLILIRFSVCDNLVILKRITL